MNFLSSTGRGFNDQASSKGTHPSSSSPSSSSSSHKILVPFSSSYRSWLSSSSTNNTNTANNIDGEIGAATPELVMVGSDNEAPDGGGSDLDLGGINASSVMIEREHMFDKVVTPSDVGKLNRLVIPKQHAEKYFPLDSSNNEKGLLLNFEDRNGKPWRFRYSYWNSSQSYVMTKGWSRFVKEKKLDAGDIVSFQRGVGDLGKDRLFIDWRRRPDAPDPLLHTHFGIQSHGFLHRPPNWNPNHPFFLHPQQMEHVVPHQYYSSYPPQGYSYSSIANAPHYYDMSVINGNPCPSPNLSLSPSQGRFYHVRSAGQAPVGSRVVGEPMVFDSVPVVQGKAAAKRLRLFGVNMDCPISEEEDSPRQMLSLSSTTPIVTTTSYSHVSQFSSSPSFPSSLHQFRNNNSSNNNSIQSEEDQSSDKGKASMSLDLDI